MILSDQSIVHIVTFWFKFNLENQWNWNISAFISQ